MKVTALLLTALFFQGSDLMEYRNPELDLAFQHPKSWTFVTDKKGTTRGSLPIPSSVERAKLEIFSIAYNADPDLWENIEKDFLKQMKGDVVRQWREEILGVPLLLTRGTYTEKGDQKAILSGMMYARAPRKLRFRLIAPAEGFDNLEYEFRTALQTLHTIDGSKPAIEDPNRKVTPEEAKVEPVTAPPTITILTNGKAKAKIVKGSQSLETQAGGKHVKLCFEAGWHGEKDPAGGFLLTNPELGASVKVSVNSTLDSDAPALALLKASSKTLDDYMKVATRDESQPHPSSAGVSLATVWRTGTGAKGPLETCEAYGLLGGFYWLGTYRKDGALAPAERRAVDSLLTSMSVELVP